MVAAGQLGLRTVAAGTAVWVDCRGSLRSGSVVDVRSDRDKGAAVDLGGGEVSCTGVSGSTCRLVVYQVVVAMPGRVLAQEGYTRQLLEGWEAVHTAATGPTKGGSVVVWHCPLWFEGLFSLVFWSVSWLEHMATCWRQSGAT